MIDYISSSDFGLKSLSHKSSLNISLAFIYKVGFLPARVVYILLCNKLHSVLKQQSFYYSWWFCGLGNYPGLFWVMSVLCVVVFNLRMNLSSCTRHLHSHISAQIELLVPLTEMSFPSPPFLICSVSTVLCNVFVSFLLL